MKWFLAYDSGGEHSDRDGFFAVPLDQRHVDLWRSMRNLWRAAAASWPGYSGDKPSLHQITFWECPPFYTTRGDDVGFVNDLFDRLTEAGWLIVDDFDPEALGPGSEPLYEEMRTEIDQTAVDAHSVSFSTIGKHTDIEYGAQLYWTNLDEAVGAAADE